MRHTFTPHPSPGALAERYARACAGPNDISKHLPLLYRLARQCSHVTELGVRGGNSTTALLHAQPERLVSIDINHCPIVDALAPLAGRTAFTFVLGDSRRVFLDPRTDLLFVDTWHTYGQLAAELAGYAGVVTRWIVLHDTTTFGDVGEDGGRGLWPAVEEFLAARPAWRLRERLTNQNGLTVLERVGERGA